MLVAVVAAVGNLLQGWDNATIAGNSFQHPKITNLILEMSTTLIPYMFI